MPHLIYRGGISWKTQGHQVESRLRNPQRILAANRKVNGIGSRDKEGAWGCNNRSTGKALPRFSLPKRREVRRWGPEASPPAPGQHLPMVQHPRPLPGAGTQPGLCSRERGGRITRLLTASDKEKASAHTSDKSLISVSQGGFLPPPPPDVVIYGARDTKPHACWSRWHRPRTARDTRSLHRRCSALISKHSRLK